MKRALIIVGALLVGLCIVLGVAYAYEHDEEEVAFEDLSTKSRYINSAGEFVGTFTTDLDGRSLSGFDYEIEDGILYITAYQTAGTAEAMKADKNGYVELRIPNCKNVKAVYYVADGEENKMTFNK